MSKIEPRTVNMLFKVSAREYDEIERLARAAGKKRGVYVRERFYAGVHALNPVADTTDENAINT